VVVYSRASLGTIPTNGSNKHAAVPQKSNSIEEEGGNAKKEIGELTDFDLLVQPWEGQTPHVHINLEKESGDLHQNKRGGEAGKKKGTNSFQEKNCGTNEKRKI